ncbi:adenosine deaminase [Aeromicrobium sp. 636]|uniref:Adenosine deaminase n=1 Tax=Aeromicrobium senzhongii TaxID=2663859 RepID=A0A8I0EXB9_9ACTN|nr:MULTISPECIES: adenosine deaminase [Aeromicrobium]MBC9227096.1 adenosine deaminase [Aeromicrobium senzhongii]MCQ3999196.1 adenosine deaminase [Aeromicrobium sp. 636]MTB88497.1 adenosine deaminase [Aeromicrobium senzhongii]QNL94541.1 adenosine deaminase [Aeromicrobium senzhongii]
MQDFVAALPKAELHVHHVGSAAPDTVARLAARHPDSPVPSDPEALAEYFTFTDFAHFIEVYLSVVDLLRTPEDIWILTHEVGRDLAAQNVRYAELTMTPYTSIARGIAAEAYVEAIEDARRAVERDFGTALQWIFDIPGESGLPAADVTLDTALRLQPDALVGFGLGGPEIGVPRPQFAPHFAAARAAGLHSVPHAGESTGPQSIWDSIDELGAERIGHGIAAAQDPALLERLAADGIVLEVCPTSNVCTRSVPSLEEHPLPSLVEAGVTVTINSDDPPMFGTTLNAEYEIAAELLGLDEAGLRALATAAVDASFAPEDLKSWLRSEIEAASA